jgi:heterodisulfide reductase subunit A-like polyferredoxin
MGEFIHKIDVPQLDSGNSSVQRYPLTGINVLVVGAGVGGLTAALECYRKGHNVRIIEREPTISTAGKYSGASQTNNAEPN